MISSFFNGKSVALLVATAVAIAISSPATAGDWSEAMARHEAAAAKTKYQPDPGSEWRFSLETVMSDMEWRKKTAAALRNQKRPTVTLQTQRHRQLVRKAERRRLSAF